MSSYYDDEEDREEEYYDEEDIEQSESSSGLSKSFNNSEYSYSSSQIGSIMNQDIEQRYMKRLSM